MRAVGEAARDNGWMRHGRGPGQGLNVTFFVPARMKTTICAVKP